MTDVALNSIETDETTDVTSGKKFLCLSFFILAKKSIIQGNCKIGREYPTRNFLLGLLILEADWIMTR